MISSLHMVSGAGADGVVFGILSPSNTIEPQPSIDINSNSELITIAKSLGLTTTFHRAIDALPDPGTAAVLIQSLGFDRILVSGIPWGAATSEVERFKTLRSVFDHVKGLPDGDIEIVLAGSISPGNARSLVREFEAFGQSFSLHAYSGVRVGGQTDRQAVSQLFSVVN
jgi:copper homeostasis protein